MKIIIHMQFLLATSYNYLNYLEVFEDHESTSIIIAEQTISLGHIQSSNSLAKPNGADENG